MFILTSQQTIYFYVLFFSVPFGFNINLLAELPGWRKDQSSWAIAFFWGTSVQDMNDHRPNIG